MSKAVTMLNSFSAYLKLSRSYSSNEITRPRIHLSESDVLSKLARTRSNVHAALSDDFNTSVAVEELFDLVSYMNRAFHKSLEPSSIVESTDLNRNYACVMSAASYVQSTLEMLGLRAETDLNALSRSDEPGGLKTPELIASSLRFRNAMRNLALDKTVSAQLPREVKHAILKHCDQFRSDLRDANIEFKVILIRIIIFGMFKF
jgi:cysteinyl-tRNA synthetase